MSDDFKQPTELLEKLVRNVSAYAPNGAERLLRDAFLLAEEAHRPQVRRTGEPYVNHCLETALILSDLQLEPPVIAAGLLHDTVEDTPVTLGRLGEDFGEEVALLVDGVTKLGAIAEATGSRKRDMAQAQAENLRKLFLAMSKDVRVVLIKLSDRLHNMRTLHGHRREKQLRIAQETMDIYAPLANRLGIWQLKWQLEDLCLRYLEPSVYLELYSGLNEDQESKDRYLEALKREIAGVLRTNGIEATITSRSKHIYSIYRKMRRKDRDLDRIFDVRAVRIIVKDKAACYATLGLVHSMYKPISGEFDDYIANPKANNYQSLHTALFGPDNKPVEVQIRDEEMHQYAEYGVAAHWRYKEGTHRDNYLEERVRVIRQLLDIRPEDDEDYMDYVREEVHPERVFVLTPRGDIKDMPSGATTLDFAYYVHTDVGNHYRGAMVNGNMVPLGYVLQNGDRIEIITNKRSTPSRDWLDPRLNYANTSRARSKIRGWFRKQDREENIRAGRDLLERELRRLGLPMTLEKVVKISRFDKLDDLLESIGAGDTGAQSLAVALLDEVNAQKEPASFTDEVAAFNEKQRAALKSAGDAMSIDMGDIDGLLFRMAGCCNPVPGDTIVGYVTRGAGLTVHNAQCGNVRKFDPERVMALNWKSSRGEAMFQTGVRILAFDRDGLLRDILDVVADERVNMLSVNALGNTGDGGAIVHVMLEVHDAAQLSKIIAKINRLPNVVEAHRSSQS